LLFDIVNVSGFAAAASFIPLMFRFDCVTVIDVIITLLLSGILEFALLKTGESERLSADTD